MMLLVEDSSTDAKLAIETLTHVTELDAKVTWVKTLEEAKALYRSCDVLLSDLHLPDADLQDVMTFCHYVRSKKPVVVFSSAYGSEAARLAGKYGLGFLRKPLAKEYLVTEIQRAHGILDAIREHDSRCERGIAILEKAEADSILARG